MELAVGAIVEGKVTGITKFGAFVALPGNKTGMVHISEIAHAYVSDINEYLTIGQDVKVKIIAMDQGKINLSIKKTMDPPARTGRSDNRGPGTSAVIAASAVIAVIGVTVPREAAAAADSISASAVQPVPAVPRSPSPLTICSSSLWRIPTARFPPLNSIPIIGPRAKDASNITQLRSALRTSCCLISHMRQRPGRTL